MTVIEYCREKTEVGELVIIREGGWVTCAAYIDYSLYLLPLPQLQSSHSVCRLNPSSLHLLLLRGLLGELDTIRREDTGRIAVEVIR